MKKDRNSAFWALSLCFVVFSAIAGVRLLYGLDLLALHLSQTWTNSAFDRIGQLFSTLGGIETTILAFAVLLIWLFMTGRRMLSVRLAVAMLVTSVIEVAMKFWLPQVPMPIDTTRNRDFEPVLDVPYAYPYPSGHLLRSMLLLGAVFLLWRNKLARTMIVLALVGMSVSRVYMGVHWASDVIGGVLLGLAGLVWAFDYRKGAGKIWK